MHGKKLSQGLQIIYRLVEKGNQMQTGVCVLFLFVTSTRSSTDHWRIIYHQTNVNQFNAETFYKIFSNARILYQMMYFPWKGIKCTMKSGM